MKKISYLILEIFCFLIIFLLLFYLIFEMVYKNRIHPNVYLGDINISGLSKDEAKKIIRKEIENFEQKGVKMVLNEKSFVWHNLVYGFGYDLSFDIDSTVNKAYLVGRNGSISDFFYKFKMFFYKEEVFLEFFLDENAIVNLVRENFFELEDLSQDAKLSFRLENNNIVFFIEDSHSGNEIDYNKFISEFRYNISLLLNNNIYLNLVEKNPQIKKEDTMGLELQADLLLDLAPFILFYKEDNKSFQVEKEEFASWLYLYPEIINKKLADVKISLDSKIIDDFLNENIRPKIDRLPTPPQFEFKDGKVSVFDIGKDGLKINSEKSFLNIEKAFLSRDMNNIELVVETDEIGEIGDINDLGIKELIASGHSSFAGSPVNRRHNIKVGAEKLHGIIIKPGEEFSTVKAIGPVNQSTGYLPELVIKGNKTIAEYGGGLCQVSTTLFRAALNAGLNITERRNHSYRVSYYEPAGVDAAIYTPRPDLKFINDTGHNILIQVRFDSSNDIYFDFWGTSDGRTVSVSDPVVYNIISPGPTQIIESEDLEPGEKKCTERAIAGADAYFDYEVIYNDGTKMEKRFNSKYVPWRAVCLVGVEPKEQIEEGLEIIE